MAVYTETVELKDKVSEPAISASDRMKTLTSAVNSAKNALIMAEAKGDMKGINKATEHLGKMENALASTEQAAIKDTSAFGGMQAELAAMTGGISIAIEVVAALAAGLAVLAIAGAAMAIEASTAKAQMVSMFDALGGGKIKGEEVDEMLDGLRETIGITKDAMVPLVKEFMAMGVTGKEALEELTTAALSAKALMGGAESASKAFMDLTKKIQLAADTGQALKIPLKGLGSLADMGLTVDDVAKKMGVSANELSNQLKNGTANAKNFGDALNKALIEKGKGPLEKMGMSLSNIGDMIKEYIGDMFEDMQEPVYEFLAAVKDAFAVFSQAQPSGQAMKTGISTVITFILKTATKLVPIMKHFFLDMIIYGLKAYIALKPILKWFKELQNNETFISAMKMAWEGLKTAMIAVAVIVGVVVAVFVGVWLVSVAIGVAIWSLIAIIAEFVGGAAKWLVEWAAGAATAAYDFIKGIVDGIANGAGMVVDAVKKMAGGAKDAFVNFFKISSPSKLMMELGGHVGGGAAAGIKDETSTVASASEDLGTAAVGGFKSGTDDSNKTSGKSSGGVSVTFAAGSITINGAGKSAEGITEEMMSLALERMALATGL